MKRRNRTRQSRSLRRNRRRREKHNEHPDRVHPARGRQAAAAAPPPPKWGLAATLLALSGFATLTYEIVWTRIFALTAGPSTYAFAGTLTIVIAGIAAGSVIGSALATRTTAISWLLGLVLVATAITSASSAWFAGSSLPRHFAESLASAPRTFMAVQWERTWVMAALIGPTALGLGLAFPLALQLARRRRPHSGKRGRTHLRLEHDLCRSGIARHWIRVDSSLRPSNHAGHCHGDHRPERDRAGDFRHSDHTRARGARARRRCCLRLAAHSAAMGP